MYNKFCPSTIPCTLESSCLSINSSRWKCDGEREIRDKREMQIRGSGLSEVTLPKDNANKYRSAALGLWEGLSHSASLRSIVTVLKSHSASLRSIVIVLKCHSASMHLVVIGLEVVAAKTNESKYNFCF